MNCNFSVGREKGLDRLVKLEGLGVFRLVDVYDHFP